MPAAARHGGAEAAVQAELLALFAPRPEGEWTPRRPDPTRPAVVLVVGVNGTGKTTTIAKLGRSRARPWPAVLLAAADTFRAAASEQLEMWARRIGVPVVRITRRRRPLGRRLRRPRRGRGARHAIVVIVDTAGRLHTKHNLMDELAKIRRTIDKRLPGADPEVLFVLDATTGQNGLAQATAFHEVGRPDRDRPDQARLDRQGRHRLRHRGGACGVPVLFVGVGEKIDDLLTFDPQAFVAALFGSPRTA